MEKQTNHKVLFIAINTSDKPNEYWNNILNTIKSKINSIKEENKRINFEFIIKINISPHDLCDIIRDEEPDILHFQGHGEETGLTFSDENNKSVVAYGRGIRDTLRALTDPSRKKKLHLLCILFNCCYQYDLAKDLLDYTCFAIGTASELEIDVAKSFAVSFYSNLCRGDTYKQAYDLGEAVVNTTRKSIPIQNRQMFLEGRLPQREANRNSNDAKPSNKQSEVTSKRTLYNISAAKRAEIAAAIAYTGMWEELGKQFVQELGIEISRGALVAQKGEHATPETLVKHLLELLAGRLLSLSSFRAALLKLGMGGVVNQFSEELDK